MRDLISVIIPVYNADQYLRRCLDSILSQSYTTLEVILIDDGSQDNSPALCDALAQHDARIRVIHQENQGVSAARNAGISAAAGDYLVFIDADDYVANDFFEHLLQAATQQQADIVCCNLTELLNGEVVQLLSLPLVRSSRLVTDLPSVYGDITGNQEAYWSCATCKLIRATIAKKHQFPPLKYGEDQLYFYDLLKSEPVIYLDTYCGYYYIRNSASATMRQGSSSIARCKDELAMHKYKLEHLPECAASLKAQYQNLYAMGIHALARSVVISGDTQERRAYRKPLCDEIEKVFNFFEALSFRGKLYLTLYRYSPWLYRRMVLLKNR